MVQPTTRGAQGQWQIATLRRLSLSQQDDGPGQVSIPHIHDFNERLLGARVFSKVDLVRGYHQIPVAEEDIQKTAIVTPFGLWEFVRMPFGLKNAAQRFQRLMDKILGDLPWAFVYLGDVLVASRNKEDHKRPAIHHFRGQRPRG